MKRRLEQPEETPRTTPDMTCRKHNRELSVFCRTDQTVMCAVCASMEHRGHTLGLVCEERRVKQENLQNMLVKSQGILQGHKQTCMNKRKIIKRIQVKAREAEDFCEAVLVRVMDSLQKHLVSVRERIKIQEKAAVAEVDVSIQGIQLRMKKTMLRKAELEVLVQSESDVDFLQKWTTLQLAPEPERESQQDPEDPDLLFEPIKGALEQLGRKMEELADGFAPVSLPDDEEDDEEEESEDEESEDEESEDEESEDETDEDDEEQRSFSGLDSNIVTSEPRTRAEFLKYACRLTFDPSTAYPDLLVSSDGREVRHCSQGANSPSTRHPGRFVHRRQLLCRDPLLAECSYYEVEVEGSKAEIALAYRSMDRKSRTSVSAFGANASSWSLDRSTFYSVSHRADSVQLTTAPCQRRVGVLVKHREGVVSFYEVTETMTMVFLYRLEAEFTEPVYPGFWLGEKCRISICDLH